MAPYQNGYEGQSSVDQAILVELRLFRDEVRDDISELKNDLRTQAVTRREWEQRNHHVDSKINSAVTKIAKIEQEIATGRAPWWTYVTVFVATGALLWSVFAPI